jgi:hypothetical protein
VIEECIQEYADIGVWAVERDANGDPIVTVQDDAM